jgi:hypothetical protein
LPPVPPSAWSANSSMKRRNQFYQNNYQPQQQQQQSTPSTQQQSSITNSRLKKFNVQNNNINGGKEQSPTDAQQQQQQASFTTYQQQQASANQTKQLNGHHYGDNETKSTELNIGENEQPQKETAATATTNQGYYSNTNLLKNYDNLYETNSKPISSNDFDSSSKYDSSCEVDDKIEIIISRDHRFNDFGFTLTRSVYGSEIFVDKIRVASPAESHLYLKPNTKIYKVSLNSFIRSLLRLLLGFLLVCSRNCCCFELN